MRIDPLLLQIGLDDDPGVLQDAPGAQAIVIPATPYPGETLQQITPVCVAWLPEGDNRLMLGTRIIALGDAFNDSNTHTYTMQSFIVRDPVSGVINQHLSDYPGLIYKFEIDWGDGNSLVLDGPFESADLGSLSHTYPSGTGEYLQTIRAWFSPVPGALSPDDPAVWMYMHYTY